MSELKIVLWDRTNGIALGEFSNPPLGLNLKIDLQANTMAVGVNGYGLVLSQQAICPGDVFELRVMRYDEKSNPGLQCLRCNHKWIPLVGHSRTICPACKSPYWNKARKQAKK